MTNLRDVAKKAGVSLASASRIVNNDPSFKCNEETRIKVMQAVKELNYKPVPRKRKVSSKYQIGVIMAITTAKYSDPFFNTVLNSIETECANYGVTISYLKNFHEILNPDNLQKLLEAGLDGLIVMEELPESVILSLNSKISAIVAIDSNTHRFDSIGFDYIDSTFQALNHLKSLGHQRIAYIGGPSGRRGFLESKRLIAYREWQRTNNITAEKELVIDCNWDIDECAQKVEKLLMSPYRPSAIFAGNDTLASVILGKLYELGIKCPQDISVIGFNNIPITAHTIPNLTTIDLDSARIGQIALKHLISKIEGTCYYGENQVRIYLNTQLIIRNSTGRKETKQ